MFSLSIEHMKAAIFGKKIKHSQNFTWGGNLRDKDTLFMKKFFLAIYCFHLAIPLKKLHMGLSNLFDEMRFRLNRRFLPRKFRFKEITYIIKANFSNMVAQRQKKKIVSFINLNFIFKALPLKVHLLLSCIVLFNEIGCFLEGWKLLKRHFIIDESGCRYGDILGECEMVDVGNWCVRGDVDDVDGG